MHLFLKMRTPNQFLFYGNTFPSNRPWVRPTSLSGFPRLSPERRDPLAALEAWSPWVDPLGFKAKSEAT